MWIFHHKLENIINHEEVGPHRRNPDFPRKLSSFETKESSKDSVGVQERIKTGGKDGISHSILLRKQTSRNGRKF